MTHYMHALDASEQVFEGRKGTIARLVRHLLLALRIRRERDQLAKLSDTQLTDIGMSRDVAERESERALMDIPAHRKAARYL